MPSPPSAKYSTGNAVCFHACPTEAARAAGLAAWHAGESIEDLAAAVRFLRANWLALDAQLLDQGRISHYRLLEADVGKGLDDSKAWDYAVILEYRDRQAMDAFVPAYLELIRTRPQVRIDGLVFADLGEVVQQKITQPLDTRLE